jgi:hypothetical protein
MTVLGDGQIDLFNLKIEVQKEEKSFKPPEKL